MKRNWILLLGCILTTLTATAQKFTQNGISYEVKEGYAYVRDIDKTISRAVFPHHVTNKGTTYAVVGRIRSPKNYFESYYSERTLDNLTFEEGWMEIPESMAREMKNLREVTIPSTVKVIGEGAFSGCKSLEEVRLPDGLTKIGNVAFSSTSIKRLVIPEGVTSIGYMAFYGCRELEEVVIPSSVKTIGNTAFNDCKALKKVVFLGEVEKLEHKIFQGCTNLTSIILPNSIKTIEYEALAGCVNLKSIILPDNATFVSEQEAAEMGKDVVGRVKKGSFNGCTSLRNIKCHNGTVPQGMAKYVPENCPFMINGGKSTDPDFDKALLADNHLSEKVEADAGIRSSDVDVAIPLAARDKEGKTYAIVIGNKPEGDDGSFAERDAEVFAEYCTKTLGLPKNNIHLLTNASYAEMLQTVKLIQEVQKAYGGKVKIVFFFSGGSVFDEETDETYLLPSDADGSIVEICYGFSKLLADLTDGGAESVRLFIDAGVKEVREKPKGDVVTFLANSGDVAAASYKEKFHGAFTYFLLKKLKDTKGACTLGELGDYLQASVRQKAETADGKGQMPAVITSPTLTESWKVLKLR